MILTLYMVGVRAHGLGLIGVTEILILYATKSEPTICVMPVASSVPSLCMFMYSILRHGRTIGQLRCHGDTHFTV